MAGPSEELRQLLRQRIAQEPRATGDGDWPSALAHQHGVCLIDGDNVVLWFLDEQGRLYELDRDKAVPRLEEITNAGVMKAVLERACEHLPELRELLKEPVLAPDAPREIASPDGRFHAQLCMTTNHEHDTVDEVTVTDAATGARLCSLQLRDPGHRLVRFLAPRRLLLVADDRKTFFELDFDAGKPRRQVLPSLVHDEYAERAQPSTLREAHAAPFVGVLTSEPSLVSRFLWFWVAGLLPLFAAIPALAAGSVAQGVKSLPMLVLALVLGWLCVRIGLRERNVSIGSGGDVRVRWGESLPLTLRRVPARELEALEVVAEKRVALTARGTSTGFGTLTRPDRFRLSARHRGRRVDLGTYASEAEAAEAKRRVSTWAPLGAAFAP